MEGKTISEIRKQVQKEAILKENQYKGISESTGLRILDGIYLIIDLLHHNIADGADNVNQIREK